MTTSTDPAGLLERETEIVGMTEAFEEAALGIGQVVLVTGEAGIGKTSLVMATQLSTEKSELAGAVSRGRAIGHAEFLEDVRDVLLDGVQ